MGEESNRPFNIVPETPIAIHGITIVIRTLKMTYTSRAPEGQSKIILDIRGFGGVPMATVAHLVHAVH
jgi:hypothetical protein